MQLSCYTAHQHIIILIKESLRSLWDVANHCYKNILHCLGIMHARSILSIPAHDIMCIKLYTLYQQL